jgi:ABC-type uncharacterized transport system ATPase subunit
LSGLKLFDKKGVAKLNGVSLEVREGEILGIAGVEGNGQTELVEVITGLRKPQAGRVVLDGKDITGAGPQAGARKRGGPYPEDRHRRGLVLDYSLAFNAILGIHYLKPFVKRLGIDIMNQKPIEDTAKRLIEEFDVRPTGT